MIGVVMAVRDQAQYVEEAIRSVLNQTLAPSQLVFVDDGSSDGTGEIAAGLGAQVIRTEGIGSGPARRLGMESIETEYFCLLDGDDRYTPDHNERLFAGLGDADAAAGMMIEFYDPGREEELAARYAFSPEPRHGAVGGTMLIRTAAYQRTGGFAKTADHHDFFGFVHELGEYDRVDHVVLERRIHGANRTIVDREGHRREFLLSARAAIEARRRGGTG
jgi:glycosyltransferase involved in cell wall biosynthesis